MLRFLRKKENVKKIVWALAILIIPAFVLWGSGRAIRSRDLPKYAGKIFGKKISLSQYEASLRACRNQALLVYGDDFAKIAKFLNLEHQAWEQLILLYRAAKEKIRVADEEVVNFIEQLPLFQKQGRFNQERYKIFLDYALRINPRDFEEQIRDMLIIEKLKDKVVAKVSASEEEIKEMYKKENKLARALYIFIDPEEFRENIHPAYEQLQDYYQNYKRRFEKPAQVNVQYIALYFEPEDPIVDSVQVSEEEISSYYQGHLEQFSVKDKKGQEGTRPQEEVKEQIQEMLRRNKLKVLLEDTIWKVSDDITDEPASFEQAAKKNQLEVQETGFFGPQEAVREIGLSYEFLNTAFSLQAGEVSNVIETAKGYFIIKLKEKKQAYIPTLDEVKQEVETAVIKEQSWQLAKNKGEEWSAQLKKLMEEEGVDFSQAAKKLSLTVEETEEFSRFSYIAGIGQSQEFTQAAFALKPGGMSDLISVHNGYCILSLQGLFPIDEERFVQEKEEFATRLRSRKKDTFYKIWLGNLKRQANLENNIGNLSKNTR